MIVSIAGTLGALWRPEAAIVCSIAFATAYIAAILGNDFSILRIAVAEQEALTVLAPLREGELYPLNPATLPPENTLTVCQQIMYRRPKKILEIGSGSSTLLMARCLGLLEGADRSILSLEHVAYWQEDSARKIEHAGLGHVAQVVHAPIREYKEISSRWYDVAQIPDDAGPFDLVLVDGPEGGSKDPLARYGVFPLLRDRLAPGAVLLLDDGLRDGEAEAVRRWQALEPKLKVSFARSRNGMWVVELPADAADPPGSASA